MCQSRITPSPVHSVQLNSLQIDKHKTEMFSRIQSLGLAAVLEDCSTQLDVLGLTLAVQMDRQRGPAAEQEKARLTKLRICCQSVSQQVFKLHSELEEKQSCSSFLKVVEEVEQRKKAEDMSLLSRDLNDQLNEQSSRKKFEEKIRVLDMLRDTKRAEELEDQRELLQIKLKQEKDVHERSVQFLQSRHKQQLQQLQQSTGPMLQEKEQELNSLCCKRTVNLDRLSEMRRKVKEMEQVVLEEQEELKELRRQQAEARAATKSSQILTLASVNGQLQAWWRGCMVRQGLGSFKKADDKKGKKKKGKKTKEGKKTGKKNRK
ncbi:IQ domain-containing protein G [Liparis tanakae]|uniref:IQ domain-containing protein G n=1 Tax=Liparis tanakae TaxID=230148 RepID=A0A4Z2I6I1_9TELE|nr:IQ domain-containing protein G [Liparis tanakae]